MRAGPGPERVSRVTRAEPSEGTVMRPILEMAVEEKQHKTDRWRAAEESRDGRPKGRGSCKDGEPLATRAEGEGPRWRSVHTGIVFPEGENGADKKYS